MEIVRNDQFQEKFSGLIESMENTQNCGGRCPNGGELDTMEKSIRLLLDYDVPANFDKKAAIERLRPFILAVGFKNLKYILTGFINHIKCASH